MSRTYFKEDGALLDWLFDWTDWLDDGEEITDATITLDDGIHLQNTVNTGNTVVVWLSGGAAGTKYNVTNTITTNQSRVDERTIVIWVTEG